MASQVLPYRLHIEAGHDADRAFVHFLEMLQHVGAELVGVEHAAALARRTLAPRRRPHHLEPFAIMHVRVFYALVRQIHTAFRAVEGHDFVMNARMGLQSAGSGQHEQTYLTRVKLVGVPHVVCGSVLVLCHSHADVFTAFIATYFP